MIIAFAGRLHSGKSALSHVCERYGFERIYFALPLKQLIAHLINGTIDDVNAQKRENYSIKFNDEQLSYISEETSIPLEIVKKTIGDVIFHNTREMLQIIGTDLIRANNQNWHVNKVRELIEDYKNYVIDDMRFPNEKQMVDELGGFSFFIVRLDLEQISNHISETSLRWQMFSQIIINDGKIDQLIFRWETFMENGLVNSINKRAKLISKIANSSKLMSEMMSSVNSLDTYKMLFINKEELMYDDKYTDSAVLSTIDKLETFENKIYRVYFKNSDVEIVSNPLMIEDLKFLDNKKD